jgi:hypothetical protein
MTIGLTLRGVLERNGEDIFLTKTKKFNGREVKSKQSLQEKLTEDGIMGKPVDFIAKAMTPGGMLGSSIIGDIFIDAKGRLCVGTEPVRKTVLKNFWGYESIITVRILGAGPGTMDTERPEVERVSF